MGRRCVISGCLSTSRLPEHRGVTYHSFPLDPVIRNIWVRNSHLSADRQITKSVLVCSRHFRRIDFHPMRSGKYLLKQRVFPTLFPWGKMDDAEIEEDEKVLKNLRKSNSMTGAEALATTEDDTTTARVKETVAVIMAKAAELDAEKTSIAVDSPQSADVKRDSPSGTTFQAVASFNPGARLEAQDFDGVWHAARVAEVDNDEREVLIRFERGKNKASALVTEEWIPMNSTRLRQKKTSKTIPVFEIEERCMARWTGPRKFAATVKKIVSQDRYEVLFDDGFVKNVRAIHMSKMVPATPPLAASTTASENAELKKQQVEADVSLQWEPSRSTTPLAKKRSSTASRRDWPLLDMSKLDLASLNLPEIPQDGEWTCHWVNDQPIGREGFLIVGEHRKPTVIVDDWRLPPGWVKHMYQRSNVLGKWDVILVSATGKRFRSKSDLKTFLEDQGLYYNPDIYDFSIHRRRAKDINAYVYTPDYQPQQPAKAKSVNVSVSSPMNSSSLLSSTLDGSTSQYIEAPVASPMPPMELMTPARDETDGHGEQNSELTSASPNLLAVEKGFTYIGGLKVLIIDNLFRCPEESCSKNFRKEYLLQMHVKNYHRNLASLLGSCPKIQELAERRTHPTSTDHHEPLPKNQIPNQQFFAKLHQQDIEHSRAHRNRSGRLSSAEVVTPTPDAPENLVRKSVEGSGETMEALVYSPPVGEKTPDYQLPPPEVPLPPPVVGEKKKLLVGMRRPSSFRKSNRQRTARRYFSSSNRNFRSRNIRPTQPSKAHAPAELEETRHSFNATPVARPAPNATSSGLDSPITADSGSSSLMCSRDLAGNIPNPLGSAETQKYIKENGEIIKIVRMRQEEIINCLCQYTEEDGLMIQCELCLCWQHGVCNQITKESDVPEKYVCYICRNPARARESMRYIHDQDWLFEGKLPTANYHYKNPLLPQRNEFLKRLHTLTGNMVELRSYVHSLRVKINIVNNRNHPKLYLWAKPWEGEEHDPKTEEAGTEPNVPQPEAPIEAGECQERLIQHIRHQQNLANQRILSLDTALEELLNSDYFEHINDHEMPFIKEVLSQVIKDLEVMRRFSKLNAVREPEPFIPAPKRPRLSNTR